MTKQTAMEAIRAERRRQIEIEGFTTDHDDEHDTEALFNAGYAYYSHTIGKAVYDHGIPTCWPWEARWWKPKDARRNLERAGALMLADQERWERDGLPPQALTDQVLRQIIAELTRIEP
jgi:hypothetical protein